MVIFLNLCPVLIPFFSTKGIANYTTAISLCSILGEEIDLGVVTLKLDKCQTNTTSLDFNFLKMKNQIIYIDVDWEPMS